MADQEVNLLIRAKDEASKVLGGIAHSIVGVGKAAAGLAVGGIAAAGAAVAGLGVASFEAAQTMDGAFDSIAIKTGATGEELQALQEDFKIAFSGVPADAETVASALGTVSQKLGLTGTPLQDVTKQLVLMSDMMGGDATTAAAGFTEVMQKWGVPVEDASTQLDKMFVAAQESGLGVETLMQKVVTFAAPMQQLGFTLDETAGMMAKWEKSGLNADKMMVALSSAASKFASSPEEIADEISKAEDKLRKYTASYKDLSGELAVAEQKQKEFSKTTKESEKMALANKISELKDGIAEASGGIDSMTKGIARLKESTVTDIPAAMSAAVESIKGAKDETEALGMAADLFGAKAAPDLVKAIRSGAFSADDLVKAMQGAEGAIVSTAESTADFPEKLEIMKNKATVALAPIGGLIMDAIGGGLDAIAPHLDTALGWFTNVLGPGIEDVMGDIEDGFGEAGLAGGIASGVQRISELLGMSKEDAVAFGDGVYTALTGAQAVFESVVKWVQDNWPTIQSVIEGVFAGIGAVWTGVLQPVLSALFTAIGEVVNWVIENWPTISATIETVFAAIKGFWDSTLSPVLTAIGTAIGTVVDAVITNWPQISATIDTVFQAIKTVWETVLWPIMTLIPQAIGEVVTWVTENWPTISATFEAVFAAIQTVWDTVLKPVVDTIVSNFRAAVTWVTTNWPAIKRTFETVFKAVGTTIDTVVKAIGKFVTDAGTAWTTLKTAVETTFTLIKTSIETAINGAITFLTGIPEQMLTFGKNIIQGIIDGINAAPTAIMDALGGIVNGAIDSVKKTLGIQSPSKLFAGFGKNMMLGMAEGINKFGDLPTARIGAVVSGMAVAGMSGASVINNYNYNPSYATAPNAPSQDFAIMRALALS